MDGPRPLRRWAIVALALLVIAIAVWLVRGGDGEPARDEANRAAGTSEDRDAPPGPVSAPRPYRAPPAIPGAGELLYAALREEIEHVPADARIEGIELDRAWVCAGEPLRLTAATAGSEARGATARWIWYHDGEAGIRNGATIHWDAPAAAGGYQLRFQLARDLGGRRVGILAERAVDVEVRRCVEGERQEDEPLRIAVRQRRFPWWSFAAVYQGDAEIQRYAWSFGDGVTQTTTEPEVEHAYPVVDLDPGEDEAYVVRLVAHASDGTQHEATAVAFARGRFDSAGASPLSIEVSKWRWNVGEDRWESRITLENDGPAITWERLERITRYFDGRATVREMAWSDLVVVEEPLEAGGFRGFVMVDPAEVPPDVRQIIDRLIGTDADGNPIDMAWSPFKRDDPDPPPPQDSEPAGKDGEPVTPPRR